MRTALFLGVALLLAGCTGGVGDDPPMQTTPAPAKPLSDTKETPTPLSLWRNLTGGLEPSKCKEIVLLGPGHAKKAAAWLIVREGLVTVQVGRVGPRHVETIGCTTDEILIKLNMEVGPEDGVVAAPVFDVDDGKVLKYAVQCYTDVPCDFSFHAQSIGALEALIPIYREDVGHTDAGACTTMPLEGMADHPGFNVNGFFEAGNGAMALVATGHEDSYCASGTGATHEKPMQEKVWGAIEPVPFNETDRMSLVLRCVDPATGCDHRLTLSWGALATPRYDSQVGPAPEA